MQVNDGRRIGGEPSRRGGLAMPHPDVSFEPAAFTHRNGRIEAALVIMLDNHVEEAWAALTQSPWLVEWLAPGTIELRPGGVAKLDFGDCGVVVDSKVTAIRPMRLLEYSW